MNLVADVGRWAPQSAAVETRSGFEVQVKPGRVDVLAQVVMKLGGQLCLVRALAWFQKAHVAVDAEHGTADGAGIADKVGRDFLKARFEVRKETQHGLTDVGLIFGTVFFEPGAVVVALEGAKEFEQPVGKV